MDQSADNVNTPGDDDDQQLINIKLLDEKDNFKMISPFKINKSLNLISTTWEYVRYTDNYKTLTVKEVNTKVKDFLKLNTIEINQIFYSIRVQRIFTTNHSKGVIYSKVLLNMTDEEILHHLKFQNVREIFRFKKQLSNGNWEETGSFALTFPTQKRPSMIKVIFLNLPVYPLIQKPMFCSHCYLIGHTSKRCKSSHETYCKTCYRRIISGQIHECINTCKNCSLPHSFSLNSCPSFVKESAILQLKSIEEITYLEAKERFNIASIYHPVKESTKEVFVNSVKEVITTVNEKDDLKLINNEDHNLNTKMQLLFEENEQLKNELLILTRKNEINKKLTDELLTQIKKSNEIFTKVSTINEKFKEEAEVAHKVTETYKKQLEISKYWGSCMKKFIDKNKKTAKEFKQFMELFMNENGSSEEEYEE